jgi:hypothetical protein
MFAELRKLIVPVAAVVLTGWLSMATADTVAVRVAASSDDAEENLGDGSMESLTSSDLELGSEFDSDPDTEGIQLAGMRFLDIQIPAGSIINTASIQFTVDEDDKTSEPANFGIAGELSLNPATFTSDAGNISGRPQTSNSVAWLNVPSWTGNIGAAGPDQLTPDISAIVQEIINQPGWTAGNAMVFAIAPIDPTTGDIDPTSLANRTAESFDGSAAMAPLLQVDFQVPEPSSAVLIAFGLLTVLSIRRRRQ